nr:integrase, catalytic region, zinc finger, CCHC-type, peptidase aspartic, catalytic [Tanacetum cinerariifolium]
KSSRSQNKEAEVEEHHRNLLLSKNNKHLSSTCNNIKLDSQNVISNVVCAMCKKCLISVNHDKCLCNYVNGKNSCGNKQKAKVSVKEIQKKYQPKVSKPKKVIQICLWCIDFCSKHMTGNLKLLINFVWKFMGTVRFGNDHVAAILGFGKSKRASHPPKPVPNSRQRLHLLHMDLCGPMRIASINGKRYVLVIVDDYSRYTWVHFLRSKDEAPKVIIKFLKRITILLQSPIIIIRTDNDTEFKNQVLIEYFDTVGISQQMSSVRTPQQNGVVERRNRTLVEAARTMLIFSRAPLFLWAEAIATACFTQTRSIIHCRFNKTPYELINDRKPNISFLHVFGALCYPKNDREDIGKLGIKGDIGFFIGYSADSCAYRIYNRRTKKIMETMNVSFDELLAMAFEQRSSKPRLNSMTSGQISSGLDLTYAPLTITTQQPTEGKLDLLFEAMYDDYIGGQASATRRTVLPAQEPQVRQTSTASTTIADTAPTPTNSSSLATNIQSTSQDVDELNSNAMVDGNTFVNPFVLGIKYTRHSYWQNNFPLPVKKVAIARRKVKPLPGRLDCYQKSRRNCQSKSNDSFTILVPHVTPCILGITVASPCIHSFKVHCNPSGNCALVLILNIKASWRVTFNLHLTFSFNSQQEMDQQYPTVAKIPVLDTRKLEQWQFLIQQYLQHDHYALWEVIEFGDSYVVPASSLSTTTTDTTSDESNKKSGRTVTLTAEDMQKKKNDVKARTTLLLSLPDEHQLRFSKYKTARELWAAILKIFGGNEATKKTKKNLLKQQYRNFKAEGSEALEQTFNRLQVIIAFLFWLRLLLDAEGTLSFFVLLLGCGLLVSVLSTPIEEKPFKSEFTFFLMKTGGYETVIGFVLLLALTVLGTCFSSLEVLEGLILNIPRAITLSLFTHLDSCGVETEFEVTGFDKAFVLPILGRFSKIGCFANLVFLLESCVLSF